MRVLYVSPMKALAVDVERNLRAPLAGICDAVPRLGLAPPSARQASLRRPRWPFERMGYFCVDAVDAPPGAPVWNRTVTLKDTWARIERRQAGVALFLGATSPQPGLTRPATRQTAEQ